MKCKGKSEGRSVAISNRLLIPLVLSQQNHLILTITSMRKLIATTILFLLLISPAAAEQTNIVGKWAANLRTRGGLGGMWIFEPNGNASKVFGALVDFRYSADGRILKTVFKDSYAGKVEEDSSPYEIVGDTLITNPADAARRQEMKRVGLLRAGVNSIVGIWTYKHYTGGMATMEYTSTGLAQLSVPFDTEKFRYTLNQEEITLISGGSAPYRRKIRIENDLLIFLPEGDNKEARYIRVVP